MERAFYEQLSHWKKSQHRKPLILRGARQVGKTYGVKTWGARSFKKIIELNFEKDKSLNDLFNGSLDPKILINKLLIILTLN